jgi:hypothetical protein
MDNQLEEDAEYIFKQAMSADIAGVKTYLAKQNRDALMQILGAACMVAEECDELLAVEVEKA